MKEILTDSELIQLISSVFSLKTDDKKLGILVDVPRHRKDDNPDWMTRRQLATQWAESLSNRRQELSLDAVSLLAYPDVGSNNADLPDFAYLASGDSTLESEENLKNLEKIPFSEVFSTHQIFLSPTEYSTTAPLKNAAKRFSIRAATMPGFSSDMIPALRINYTEVNRRCQILKEMIDPAHGAMVRFVVDTEREFSTFFDLRYRSAHVSSGRFPNSGIAGNLPSGETYIVPYEGESGLPSQTFGQLPVQIGNSILIFTIQENKAVNVTGDSGAELVAEQKHLNRVPAYGNMAELGFGVLADFGLHPINEILLDEKLGFHVAFGRSDHFGGQVSPAHFPSPADVIHLDRIYIPSTQPRISVKELTLHYPDNVTKEIIMNDRYTIFD